MVEPSSRRSIVDLWAPSLMPAWTIERAGKSERGVVYTGPPLTGEVPVLILGSITMEQGPTGDSVMRFPRMNRESPTLLPLCTLGGRVRIGSVITLSGQLRGFSRNLSAFKSKSIALN